MEYIVILALSLFDKPDLQFYNYRFIKFQDKETCETFITSKSVELGNSITQQFNQKNNVRNYIVSCWSSKEWNEYLDSIFEMNV
jgi:hypothetical protein|tara:strand:- start:729 stop:980 length:252 start_codon:yes stop_codon:yes gene_type:complete